MVLLIRLRQGNSNEDTEHAVRKNLKSSAELLDCFLALLAGHKGQRHDTTDMHVWTIDVHVELQLCSYCFDILQTLLIVGSCTANPDLNLVFNQCGCVFSESTNDTLERRCDLEQCVSETEKDTDR